MREAGFRCSAGFFARLFQISRKNNNIRTQARLVRAKLTRSGLPAPMPSQWQGDAAAAFSGEGSDPQGGIAMRTFARVQTVEPAGQGLLRDTGMCMRTRASCRP
jgi:hypothetical protein